MNAITTFLVAISRRGDLPIAILIVLAIVMMIIPLPTAMVDALITANIAVSVLIMMVAFYVPHPARFSSLPSVILISTLFRLSITISTARLILIQADAGSLVSTFGHFVIGENVAVGLVVFMIIAIAQFVVITKGAERVAEVAARFSLDAMPGKQMSIDSDLRSGEISQADAKRMRNALERESHLYGAMDGAMKFVKGDAIASLIIILVNLLGGLAVGVAQQGMSFSEAVATYSRLTVGDGLAAQIPALLVSVAAGTVVTRVASADKKDLGADIAGQLLGDGRALMLAAAIMAGFALVPGFPALAFLAVAGAMAFAGFLALKRNRAEAEEAIRRETVIPETATAKAAPPPAAVARAEEGDGKPATRYRLRIFVGRGLARSLSRSEFRDATERVRQRLLNDLGVQAPMIELRAVGDLEPNRFRIDLEEAPIAEGDIPADSILVPDEPVHLDMLSIPYVQRPPLMGRQPAIWVEEAHVPALTAAGISFFTPMAALEETLDRALLRYATHFIGIQETRELLAGAEADYPELVREAQKVVSLQRIAEILRRLAEENVPIRNLRLVLEALVEWGQREQDVVLLAEYVRVALGRQICFRVADDNRVIAAYVLERALEEALRAAVRPTAVGTFLAVPDEAARPLVEQIRKALAGTRPEVRPVVLAAMDVRRHVRTVLIRNDVHLHVLSYPELAPEFSVQPLATIYNRLDSAGDKPASRGFNLPASAGAV